MYPHLFSEFFVRDHVGDLLRDAENDRLVDLATGPGRPLRGRLADLLVTIAEWIDDRPRGSIEGPATA